LSPDVLVIESGDKDDRDLVAFGDEPALGLRGRLGCHMCRATGVTAYLEGGGTLENAQKMAAHSSPRTTKLYDRRGDAITLDEVERIGI
jgi:integrase